MIVDERMVTYIRSLEEPEERGNRSRSSRKPYETVVPIIRKETQSFLKVLLLIKRAGA